jgi:hypothetical protein
MGIVKEKPGTRSGSRDDETTRKFFRPVQIATTEPRPVTMPPMPKEDPFLLAPSPWPRGQFRIDPES